MTSVSFVIWTVMLTREDYCVQTMKYFMPQPVLSFKFNFESIYTASAFSFAFWLKNVYKTSWKADGEAIQPKRSSGIGCVCTTGSNPCVNSSLFNPSGVSNSV